MKNQKWLMLLTVFALLAGAAGTLVWLKGHQRLGRPGIKTTAIPESVVVQIDLPARVLDFTSTNVPESEVELAYFPKDTSYAARLYQAADGLGIRNTIILMGADRTSIHRPDYCLPGQGWNIDSKATVKVSLAGQPPYDLPVAKWVVSNSFQTSDGRKQKVGGVYVFWFVADNEQTVDNVQRLWWLMRDLLCTGRLQRWAYISYFSTCAPGQEDILFERMKKLIAASVPEYQWPPARR